MRTMVVCAMDMMQLPHPQRIPVEIMFVKSCLDIMPKLRHGGLDPRIVQPVIDAWQRLQRSGIIEKRGLINERIFHEMRTDQEERNDRISSALSAPGLRSCTLPSCGAREAHPQHFKSCASCRTVVYCCREHQVADWPAHKAACKAARKTAAADKGAGAASDARA